MGVSTPIGTYEQASDEDAAKMIESYPSVKFANKHGEPFVIHSDGTVVYMSGSEVSSMVDPIFLIAGKYLQLFNPSFSIWNTDELEKLGAALQAIGPKARQWRNEQIKIAEAKREKDGI